jgi:single-strand DNA-binding protein
MNSVNFVGRLVRDVQVRESRNGSKVLFNRIAVRAQRKDEEDLFINFVVFGRGAEVIGEYRTKGAEVGVTGRLRPGKPWTDAQGNEHQEMEIVANDVSLVGGAQSGPKQQDEAKPQPQDEPAINPWKDDDIAY